MTERRLLLVVVMAALLFSRVGAYDSATWWMEIAPVLIAAPILIATASRFPLTPLVYRLLALHAIILIIGGHWTYARVPAGDWVRDLFSLERNHYDRLGHFMQGFVPAIVAREILLRRSPMQRGRWLFFVTASVCLAISACYEFIEWWAALLGGEGATEFLGTQGDPWDTQWDMFLALIGSLTAQLTLARRHDREIAELPPG